MLAWVLNNNLCVHVRMIGLNTLLLSLSSQPLHPQLYPPPSPPCVGWRMWCHMHVNGVYANPSSQRSVAPSE